jgi:hypothetical protein
MWHIGIDLHRATVVIAAVDDSGRAADPVRISCQDTDAILRAVGRLKPFRAVIEATSSHRWSNLPTRRGCKRTARLVQSHSFGINDRRRSDASARVFRCSQPHHPPELLA